MSDLDDEEILYTKMDNNTIPLESVLDYWYMKYGVPEYQINYMKNKIELLRRENNG